LDVTKERKYRPAELERRLRSFGGLADGARAATSDEGLVALTSFLHSQAESGKAGAAVSERANAGELLSNHLIAFALAGVEGYLHDRPAVRQYWARYRSSLASDEEKRQCLVTGEFGPTADKHPPIKHVPGGTPSGVAIVSFNCPAFESYAFSRNNNAPVSRSAAEGYTTALNRLLDPTWPDPRNPNEKLPEQRVLLSSDTVALFWAEGPSLVPAAIGPAVALADPTAAAVFGVSLSEDRSYDELDADTRGPSTELLRATHKAPWTGIRPSDLDDPGAFRMLVLSGGQGRASVRGFHSSTIRNVVSAIRQWFDDISLAQLRGGALGRLLKTLAIRGDREKLPPNLAAEVFLAILENRSLPLDVLHAAIRRCRSEANVTEQRGQRFGNQKARPERVALIKAWLNRARRSDAVYGPILAQGIEYQEVRPMLNADERNRGYLLGRMFACIERMQETALGDVGATVTDRYFGAACATPQAVFPRLLKMEVHHFRKAREGKWSGSAYWLHKQVDKLAAWLVGNANGMREGESIDAFLRRSAGHAIAGFPSFLPLPEQGLFVLGYHQQRAEFFMGRRAAAETSDDEAEEGEQSE
jgi:CRISPR-associated protein Csd1